MSLKSKKTAKINLARVSLLLVIFFSVLNVFLLPVIYSCLNFLSTYVSKAIINYGGTQSNYFYYAFLSVITVIPFVLCIIFAKKHPAWMVVAFVLFCIDCIVFACCLPQNIYRGVYDGFIPLFLDILSRIYVVITLFLGMKAAFKKE